VPADTLPVHLNREDLHAVEVPPSFETTDSFDVELVNHGTSVHAHLHLDDDLSQAADLDAANHFVDGESRRMVRVSVDAPEAVSGKLKVASAYGAETRWVDVNVVEPEEEEQTVEVDESLAEPRPRDPSEDDGSDLGVGAVVASPEAVVLALGVAAVFVAGVAVLVVDSTVVLLGALVVLVAVLAAMYVLVSG
jgi:hypothetical protein